MEKRVFLVFVFVLCLGGVVASGSWGDFNNGKVGVKSNNTSVAGVQNITQAVKSNTVVADGNSGIWTLNFYIAVGLGFLILIIIGVFFWFWFRGPKDKWE